MCTVQHSLVHRFGRGCRRQRASALPSARAAHDGRAHPRELLGRGRRLARVGLASGTRYSALMSLGLRLRSRLRERRAHRRRLCAQMNKLSYIRGDAALLLKEYLLWPWFGLVRRPVPTSPLPHLPPCAVHVASPRPVSLCLASVLSYTWPSVSGQLTSGATESALRTRTRVQNLEEQLDAQEQHLQTLAALNQANVSGFLNSYVTRSDLPLSRPEPWLNDAQRAALPSLKWAFIFYISFVSRNFIGVLYTVNTCVFLENHLPLQLRVYTILAHELIISTRVNSDCSR